MTQDEFIGRMVGVPWVKWRADWDACDCYGLVVMFYRHVLSIELGNVPQMDIAAGMASLPQWRPLSDKPDGVAGWMVYVNGEPIHCGISLGDGYVLHCTGREDKPGNVRRDRMAALKLIYQDIRFYAVDHP